MNDKKTSIIKLVDKIDILGQEINSYRETPRIYGKDDKPLTEIEIRLLHKIGQKEGMSAQELSKSLRRTKGAISVMINRLAEEGYLERIPVKEDRRRYELRLTEKGRYVYGVHNAIINEYYFWLAKSMGKYRQEEIEKCCEIIDAIIDYWVD